MDGRGPGTGTMHLTPNSQVPQEIIWEYLEPFLVVLAQECFPISAGSLISIGFWLWLCSHIALNHFPGTWLCLESTVKTFSGSLPTFLADLQLAPTRPTSSASEAMFPTFSVHFLPHLLLLLVRLWCAVTSAWNWACSVGQQSYWFHGQLCTGSTAILPGKWECSQREWLQMQWPASCWPHLKV